MLKLTSKKSNLIALSCLLAAASSLGLGLGAVTARADDGEGLAAPRAGTAEAAAYDAADAQYWKDDGNNAYHLQAIKLLDGYTTEDQLTYEVDFYSAEDGEYDYSVVVNREGTQWVAGAATRVNQ